ncbi:MAG: ABC transporter substrate-binding protein [Candidatus Hermodarchaeia archaeon]|jgi:peptide/nickel transport system substrate-binding protein
MNRKLKNASMLVLVGLITLVLVACASTATDETTEVPEDTEIPVVEPTEASQPTEVPEPEPVVLRIGITHEPDCLNVYACGAYYHFLDFIYEGLSGFGPNCTYIPRLAKSMELSEDGLTWTIYLQEGVTFSDGEPFNAYAMEGFWNWVTTTEIIEWYWATNMAESWEALDEHTFQFTTFEPLGNFERYDALWMWHLPPQVWGELDDVTIYEFENASPVGTGPYVLTDWRPGEYLIYDAREDYWGGPPPIDRIVMQVYSNWDSLIQAILAGEVDLTDLQIPAQYFDALSAGEDVTVVEQPPHWRHFIAFNLYSGGLRHPAVEDLKLRQAIDYAIDRDQLVNVAFLGRGITCPTGIVCSPAYDYLKDPSLSITPYNPSEANRILDEAGYVDTDGDGIREMEDGLPLEFRFLYNSDYPAHVTMASMISDWLLQIGIGSIQEGQEEATLFNTIRTMRDFDMAISYYFDPPDTGDIEFFLSCWSADGGAYFYNDSGYCDQEMDDLIYTAITSLESEDRVAAFLDATKMVSEELPFINLAGDNAIQAYRNDRFLLDEGCPQLAGLYDAPTIMNAVIVE